MTAKRILTVGLDLPGGEFEYVPFGSDQSLLDADIVLFRAGFGFLEPQLDYQGESLFGQSSSVSIARGIAHWRSELIDAVNAGKLVIVFLTRPVSCFKYTGRQEHSGTGRSRTKTDIVERVGSYEAVPRVGSVEAKSGREVRLTPDASFLASYWHEFGAISPYEAVIDGKFTHQLLVTKSGDRTVGAAILGNGSLLFLPPLHIDEDAFTKVVGGEQLWNAQALRFGKRLMAQLIELQKALGGASATPPPAWVLGSAYGTPEESAVSRKIGDVSKKIERLQKQRTKLQQDLATAGEIRALLYEKGKPLERAVRTALEAMGFLAANYRDGDSEFDVVFECDEGRCLGEVEGRDNKAINIDKFSQLERNLQEDFARDDVEEFAKAVLFGNGHRLTPLDDRGDTFTAKCMTAASRVGAALLRTPDLFAPTRYLQDTPDATYAAACRKAIFETSGAVVTFPAPPVDLGAGVQERPADTTQQPEAEVAGEVNPA